MRKCFWQSFLVFFLLTFMAGGWYFWLQQAKQQVSVIDGQGQLIRLHVVANSDDPQDQKVKLQVRDSVIAYLAPLLQGISDVTEAREIVLHNQQQLINIAQGVLASQGADYPVNIQIGVFDFPMKVYGDLVLPPGKYEAVRILLGQAEGKNWWCVLFPPLCFIDSVHGIAQPIEAGNSLGSEPLNRKVEFRWKIAELWTEEIK